MKCPKCGNEVPDGYLLCEKCGAEVMSVPDFEPEIESSITESLSNIAEELAPEPVSEEKGDKTEYSENDIEDDFFKESRPLPKRMLFYIAAVIVVIISGIFAGVFLYHNFSAGYQLRQADALTLKGDYDDAFKYIARAKELSPGRYDIKVREADIYLAAGMNDEAENVLLAALSEGTGGTEEKYLIYDRLVTIYEEAKEYDKISALLEKEEDEELKESYSAYVSDTPYFEKPTGNYDEAIDVIISADGEGKIFYTTDESIPSEINGTLYTSPIKLNSGEYTFKAVFINKYGISSNVSTCFYHISAGGPAEPEVLPLSGDFDRPFKITVEDTYGEGVLIYYTTDGSIPDEENGILYENPINAEQGTRNYSFVAVDEEGRYSDTVKRSYSMHIENAISAADAKSFIYRTLLSREIISDISGKTVLNGNAVWYSYEYNSVLDIDGGIYYIFDEYIIDEAKNVSPTKRKLAAEVYSGLIYEYTDNGLLLI